MRGARSWIVVASLAALAAACTDAPQGRPSAPTAPNLAAAPTTGACASGTARIVYGEIGTIYSNKYQTNARTLFRAVESACTPTTMATAQARAIAYYRYLLEEARGANPTGVVGSPAAAAQHVENVVAYVGGTTQFVPEHFTADGAIGLCPSKSTPDGPCVLKTGDNEAGISVPNAALPGGLPRLFSIAPATTCRRDNLELLPECYEFHVTPALGTNEKFAADVAVSVCVDGNDGRYSRLRLAHPEPRSADPKRIEVAPPTSLAAFAGDDPACGVEHTSRDLNVRGSGLLAVWHQLGAVAARGWSYLGPRAAYAVHAGVGGSVRELSPFGAVDPLVFSGIFEDNDGVAPDRFPLGPFPATVVDARGSWTSSYSSPPASISIAESLGDLGTDAGDRVVVLNQGGGACLACPQLSLTGSFRAEPGTTADVGRYRVVWSSVQAKETSKLAPIDLQDADGDVIARLAYRTVGSENRLVAFGQRGGVPVEVTLGFWKVNASNTFELLVDLKARTFTVVSIAPALAPPAGATSPVLPTLGFLENDADALERYVVEFKGIDAGILGIDDVGVTRLPDRAPNQP